jgi:hypothetical protein
MLFKGAKFFHVSPDDFASINKEANKKGLMARIFELDGKAGAPDMKISFELVDDNTAAGDAVSQSPIT